MEDPRFMWREHEGPFYPFRGDSMRAGETQADWNFVVGLTLFLNVVLIDF